MLKRPVHQCLQMCADGDRGSAEAADLLQAAGYSAVMQMEGGYAGYSKVRPGLCGLTSWCDRCAVLSVLLDSLVCAA